MPTGRRVDVTSPLEVGLSKSGTAQLPSSLPAGLNAVAKKLHWILAVCPNYYPGSQATKGRSKPSFVSLPARRPPSSLPMTYTARPPRSIFVHLPCVYKPPTDNDGNKIRTREAFRNYFRGIDRKRLRRLLREAYADRGSVECDAKVQKRLVLLERSLMDASFRR